MPSYTQYLRQMAVLDASDDDIESWITVKGNHIPIRKGQSKEDAVKSFVESKGGKYKQESYGKHYVKTGEKGDEKYVDPRTDTLHREKSKVGFFGSEKEAKEYAYKLNHTDPYAGTEFAVKNYKRTVLPYEVESEEESKKDTEKPKNTFLSNPNTLKEFANHFGISESAAKNAAEKYGDEFYNTMVKDPMKGVGMAVGGEKKSEPKSNKQVFYKNISGKQIGSPKGRTFIENEIMTEKEMAKRGFDPTDKRFERKELGKNDHHFFFGARFENAKPEKPSAVHTEEPKKWNSAEINKHDFNFRRQMLSRLKQDNDYFLGNGGRAEKHLWAGNVKEQIQTMRDVYKALPDKEKPEWLTEKQINDYEKKMGGGEKKSGGYTIPEDYKASVKNYTKEKHEQAANFYGEKMATAQKRANRENDPNVNIFRNQFNEYQALSHWHAEQAKGEKKSESKKDTGSIIKQSKVKMTNGLKHITHTTPEGYKFSVWESSNDPGWKTNNLPADYFETEAEATEAATKQFEKDLKYYNSGEANKKGKQIFEEKYGTKKTESKK